MCYNKYMKMRGSRVHIHTYFVAGVLLADAYHDLVGVVAGVEHDHVRAEQHVAQDETWCDRVGLVSWRESVREVLRDLGSRFRFGRKIA